jgi:HEAT repeat protein
MREDDSFSFWLRQCQSPDPGQRLGALEELRQEEYLDRVEGQFLLDRLNATTDWQEQTILLQLMNEISRPLPTRALMAILADRETPTFLRMGIAHTLAVAQAEEAFALLMHLLHDGEEEIALREVVVWDLPLWADRVPRDFLRQLLADPDLCAAAMDAWREQPAESIPIAEIVPYCTHEDHTLRVTAIKALLAAGQHVPLEVIFAALRDPEPDVRTAASYGCIGLMTWFGDQIPLEPLLAALSDTYPPVRENMLDALGKIPLRIPVEPVIAALLHAEFYVRCAALETLAVMGERVPSSLYPLLQAMSGADPVPQVRMRATRALLLLHGIEAPPLRVPIIDLRMEHLENEEE